MGDAIEQCHHLLKFAGGQILRDEDNPRPLIFVRPFGEPSQVVQQMLRALDDRRLAGFFADVHQSGQILTYQRPDGMFVRAVVMGGVVTQVLT